MPPQFHKFRNKAYPDALITCEEFEDLGGAYLLRAGRFIFSDGTISIFDYLILRKAETEKIEEQPEKNREGRRPPEEAAFKMNQDRDSVKTLDCFVSTEAAHACDNPNCSWSSRKNVRGIEIVFDGAAFTFRYGDRVAGPYTNIYRLEPQELAEKLGIDNENTTFARFTALQIFEEAELGIEDLVEALGITIKHDDINKAVTFLVMLSAFTYDDQLNLSFRAESSTGKSYIPLEVSTLFPQERVIRIAYSSPTSFFHDRGVVDEETKEITIDLEKKILIFLDQPHDQLLERLRPLLSHDQKELHYKITDKREKLGLRTKNVKIIGFPSVIFCSGRLKMDEQESTRMILLSPEVSQEKFREAVYLKILKEADEEAFREYVESNPKRKALRERVKKIAKLNIKKIIIEKPEKIAERFISSRKILKPRHARDAGRIMALIKTMALLNYDHRKMEMV